MPSKFSHRLDPMPHPGMSNKLLTFSFDTADSGQHAGLAADASAHIRQAIEDIETAITKLNHTPKTTAALLERLFFCDLSKAKTIASKLELIYTGLQGNQRIKIGTIPMSENGTAAGAVKIVKKQSLLDQPRPYYNKLDGTTYGAMYFDPESIKAVAGPRLVIHEASHKYAGTSDYFYFEPVGMSSDFRIEPTKLFKQYLIEDQALDNADSYAWLCHKLTY